MKKRFLKMKFSEKETYQFVKAYFKQETLWNNKDLGYKSNQRRLVAYNAMIEDFKEATGMVLTLTELRMKIKNLKSTYLQEVHKIRTRSEGNYQYKPAMKWFALWHKYAQGACDNNYSTEELNTTDDENQQKFWLPETTDNTHNTENSVDPFESQTEDMFLMDIKSERKLKRDHSNLGSRTRQSFEHSDVSDLNISETANSPGLVRDDEFEIYGRYVASQLRNMDLQRALTVQAEIQNLVSAARLADLKEKRNSRKLQDMILI